MKLKPLLPLCIIVLLFGCGKAVPPRDPVGVVKAQIDAIDKAQIDVATDYFSEDAGIIAPLGQPKGKEKIRAFMLNLTKVKEHIQIIDLAADGANVTGTIDVKDTLTTIPIRMNLKATVLNGKITNWEVGTKAQ
jgi:limonene-1,2-epoxide hydrolase